MTDADHEELLHTITQSKAQIMISGYASEMYDDYLQNWNRMEFRGTAEHAGVRTEVIWMHYNPDGQMSIEDFLRI